MTRARAQSRLNGVWVVIIKGEAVIAYTTEEAAQKYANTSGGYIEYVTVIGA